MKRIYPLFLLAALSLAACAAWSDGLPPLIYSHQQSLPAHADGTIRFDLDSQDVSVQVRSGNTVQVKVTLRSDADDKRKLIERYVPVIETEGNDIVIRSPHLRENRRAFWFNNRTETSVEVALPPGMNVHFELDSGNFAFNGPGDRASITGSADSGDIAIRSAAQALELEADSGNARVTLDKPAQRVRIHTDSGEIRFHGDVQRLSLGTDSGDIVAAGRVQDAELKTDSGDMRIVGLEGSLRAKTDSGSIDAHWHRLSAGAAVHVRAGSGDVTVTLPADAAVTGVLATGSGELRTDFAGRFNTERTRLDLNGKPGAVPVRIETGSGDITLNEG